MINARKISKSFGEKMILNKVSYQFENGKSYAIIGKSGSGKTTLLNILGGLEEPSSGLVELNGLAVSKANVQKMWRDHLGFIFQNFGLIENGTVEANLKIGFANRRLNKSGSRSAMKQALAQVELENLPLNQRVFTLSGGEQQRIALARALLKKPDVILADEPTGSLDPENTDIVLRVLFNSFGPEATIIIATHSQEVWQKCDYVIQILDGDLQNKEVNKQ
ncbi:MULTISPECIES: ATP-binding cassette domain-containing protein [Lacticaseibacillus]|uniref:ABC transporter ATP-binding component n=1 Tax=Lacticaseibacillus casei DSM 20011 = JCM 1134 = ATCC 393 TaxID=1423732 RepID=A0AAD1ASE3_LACCA|nr:ATP-binding cassette domain-containing protein [Lacticaseibacillus casei]MBI6598266.1 ATP-binding cassette domain-containing protein [Lacticaseibacillus casei]MBO1481880.1 ATP-binding cassette domain-containing protein [Lacticaseibacillus casei]MBO2417160.1 ATP-binding cassette domain-containing protein [Lacticaseibacillus casei]MCK2081548.1 ATP-binding cassette domain-containing protein [Lacticaseibacillus casei]MDZ5496414.1 ATP-binding cassette domain-containing protein [Lacticaseibacillu